MCLRSYVTPTHVPNGPILFSNREEFGAVGRSGCWLVRASIVGAMLQVKQGVTGAQQSRELFSDLRGSK